MSTIDDDEVTEDTVFDAGEEEVESETSDDFDERLDDFFEAPAELAPVEPAAGAVPVPTPAAMVERMQERRLRARKVRRLVRHIEPWSVLKVSLLFNFCMWVVIMIAGVLLWNAAEQAGTIQDVESFATKIFALEDFAFNGEEIFNAVALGGLVVAVAATGFAVLVAILLNLISDLTGGIRVTVVEEETSRPVSTLPRRG